MIYSIEDEELIVLSSYLLSLSLSLSIYILLSSFIFSFSSFSFYFVSSQIFISISNLSFYISLIGIPHSAQQNEVNTSSHSVYYYSNLCQKLYLISSSCSAMSHNLLWNDLFVWGNNSSYYYCEISSSLSISFLVNLSLILFSYYSSRSASYDASILIYLIISSTYK